MIRTAGSLPFPEKPAGTANGAMPFDHIVVVMMENHSFDNLLGSLAQTNQGVDGLSFNQAGEATDSNPGGPHMPAKVTAFPVPNTAQTKNVSQSWKATHQQIDGGAMDGFVTSSNAVEPMGYYTQPVLPFAYSLAKTFTIGDRWFSSFPGPTYPNRRFLLAGTAYGASTTSPLTLLEAPPPHGTIFDRLSAHNISWADYFTELPMTAMIPSIVLKHLDHHHPRSRFFHDCEAGTLPAVSFVDPALGALRSIAAGLPSIVKDALELLGADIENLPPAETQEDPADMYYGELWAWEVLEAVRQSPSWPRTLLIYIYDEHGGFYDHVPPPRAPLPDAIPPQLAADDPPGSYDTYGLRVPAVVVSPFSKPGGVSKVVYDHTSVLATIESKWNLPALTDRDANAATVMDFLDATKEDCLAAPPLAEPPRAPPSGPVS
jgi:phospholipase C